MASTGTCAKFQSNPTELCIANPPTHSLTVGISIPDSAGHLMHKLHGKSTKSRSKTVAMSLSFRSQRDVEDERLINK